MQLAFGASLWAVQAHNDCVVDWLPPLLVAPPIESVAVDCIVLGCNFLQLPGLKIPSRCTFACIFTSGGLWRSDLDWTWRTDLVVDSGECLGLQKWTKWTKSSAVWDDWHIKRKTNERRFSPCVDGLRIIICRCSPQNHHHKDACWSWVCSGGRRWSSCHKIVDGNSASAETSDVYHVGRQ